MQMIISNLVSGVGAIHGEVYLLIFGHGILVEWEGRLKTYLAL